MWTRRVLAVVVAVSCGCLGAAALAQQTGKPPAPTPEWLFVSVAKVNAGAIPEYIDLQQKEVMPAQRKGGGRGREAWSSGVTGPVREFVYLSPIASFAQFDKPNPLVAALGEQGAAALNAKLSKVSEMQQTMIVRTRPDLSYRPDPKATSPLAIITIVDVVPGRRDQFEAFIRKDVLPAMQQAKARSYSVLEVVYGDSIGAYVTAVGYDSYEAIGKGHPFQLALGDDGARKLESRVAGILSRVERFISRHRPELSWAPAGGTN